MHPSWRPLPLLWLAACGPAQPDWSDCSDLGCYTDIAVQEWKQDPEGVATRIATLDAVQQEALVLAMVDAHPDSFEQLCQALPEGAGADRCRKLSNRPHLLGDKPGDKRKKAAGLPGLTDHTGVAAIPSPWAEVPAETADCDPQLDECWSKRMLAATHQLDPRAVAAVCNGIPNDRFRRECFFRSAEVTAVQHGVALADRTELAATLCLGAETYAGLCVRELARAVARGAPAADQADPAGWANTVAAVSNMQRGIAAYNQATADRVADRCWSEVLWNAYQRAELVNGLPLGVLPASAAPQVRATATWFLWEREDDTERDLASWVQHAEASLASQQARTAPPGSETRARPAQYVGSSIDPVQHEGPWVHYLGDNYRTPLAEPALDLIVCVLEAAARSARPDLLEQGLAWQDEAVVAHARMLAATKLQPVRRGPPAGAQGPNQRVPGKSRKPEPSRGP